MWLSVDEIAELLPISKQAIYNHVRKGNFQTKEERGITLIKINLPQNKINEVVSIHKDEVDSLSDKAVESFGKMIAEQRKEIEQNREAHKEEVERLSNSHNREINSKDKMIDSLEKDKEQLMKLIEKDKVGFFKRLFG